jgi:hypothetical protein
MRKIIENYKMDANIYFLIFFENFIETEDKNQIMTLVMLIEQSKFILIFSTFSFLIVSLYIT